MTEAEAKTKWCPFARLIVAERDPSGHMAAPVSPTHNRAAFMGEEAPIIQPSALCIASACMAWRWKVGYEPATIEHMRAGDMSAPDPDGFCGLAGAPQ